MISEWLYRLTEFIGNCFNNATGLRIKNEMSDIIAGISVLYIFLILLFGCCICFAVLCWRLSDCLEVLKDE